MITEAYFVGGPGMKTLSLDGRNFALIELKDIYAVWDGKNVIFRMPYGATSDGASIPRICWSFKLTPFGKYWPAAYAHDCAYQKTLLVSVSNELPFGAANLSEKDANDLINCLMKSLQVDDVTRETIHEALVVFGFLAYREDAIEALKLKQSGQFPT